MIAGAILLAAACWAVTFGLPAGTFWVKIGISVVLVTSYSLLFERPRLRPRAGSLALGLVSAAVLYLVFLAGYALAPLVLPGAGAQVGGIYDLGGTWSRVQVALLLLLVTGPGEEIFWRGFLQSRLERRLGRWQGFAAAAALYAGVHVFSANPMLILAALVAGVFWGLLWLWKRDLTALVVSHAVWSAVIFAVAPVR